MVYARLIVRRVATGGPSHSRRNADTRECRARTTAIASVPDTIISGGGNAYDVGQTLATFLILRKNS